jgi:phospholipase C
MSGLGLSIRVPLIVISPYTRMGLVSSQVGYFDSILATIEARWNLGCVVPGRTQDCGAPLMSSYFNFGMTPRAPCLFPTNASLATYPDPTCAPPSAAVQITPYRWVGNDAGLTETEAD